MNRHFYYKNFKRWLKKNRSRFHFTPYIADVRKKRFKVYFHGISRRALCVSVVDYGDFSAWTHLMSLKINYYWDWVGDFDIGVEKTSLGYRCDLCPDEDVKYYKDRSDLYEQHCYERFLRWCNAVLKDGTYIVNMGKVEGSGWSRFYTEDELKQIDPETIIDMYKIKAPRNAQAFCSSDEYRKC